MQFLFKLYDYSILFIHNYVLLDKINWKFLSYDIRPKYIYSNFNFLISFFFLFDFSSTVFSSHFVPVPPDYVPPDYQARIQGGAFGACAPPWA